MFNNKPGGSIFSNSNQGQTNMFSNQQQGGSLFNQGQQSKFDFIQLVDSSIKDKGINQLIFLGMPKEGLAIFLGMLREVHRTICSIIPEEVQTFLVKTLKEEAASFLINQEDIINKAPLLEQELRTNFLKSMKPSYIIY